MRPKIYLYDMDNSNIFVGEELAVIDPLELELNNIVSYLTPPNSTFVEPLPSKEGFMVCFNEKEGAWEYIENKVEVKNEDFRKFSPEEIEALNSYSELSNYLSRTDWYITRKLETGKEIPSDILDKRALARNKISDLREKYDFLK